MNQLIMTVGLPQSGKSTWARKQGLPIVNPDAIRLALHGQPFIAEAEPWVWVVAKTMVASLFCAGHSEVILDATNTTKKRRDEWKSRTWKRTYKIFDEDVVECKQRAGATARDEQHREGLLAAIDRMHANFEIVKDDEYDR